jgi:glutamate-1-semialdehyde aminotransferase
MWDIGRKLIDGQNALARDIGVDIEAVGLAPTPDFAFHYDDPGTARSVRKVFFEAVVDEGVFFHANHHGFVCAVHTDADVEESLAATAAGYRAVKEAI